MLPVIEYVIEIPYKIIAEAIEPNIKYFNAASELLSESLFKATNTYSESDWSSIDMNRTSDEYYIWLSTIIKDKLDIQEVIIGSVVPGVAEKIKISCYNYLKKKVYIINEDIKINFPIKLENKKEVGTDRLVNSLAAWSHYKEASIIIDFGTATTFDVVNKNGAFEANIAINTLPW